MVIHGKILFAIADHQNIGSSYYPINNKKCFRFTVRLLLVQRKIRWPTIANVWIEIPKFNFQNYCKTYQLADLARIKEEKNFKIFPAESENNFNFHALIAMDIQHHPRHHALYIFTNLKRTQENFP